MARRAHIKRRVVVAAVCALAVHAVIGWRLTALSGAVRDVAASDGGRRVTIALVIPHVSHVTEARVVPSRDAANAPARSDDVTRAAVPKPAALARDDVDHATADDDGVHSSDAAAHVNDGAAHNNDDVASDESRGVAIPRAPLIEHRSFAERVVAGTSSGPLPSLDVLDPSRKTAGKDESEAARASRFAQRVATVGPDAGPLRSAPALALVATEGGGYLYTTGGFVAEIHDDGSVTFKDDPGKAGFGDSAISGRSALAPRGGAISNPAFGDTRRDNATMVNESLSEELDQMAPAASLASISFDPTAALLRAQGQDPYEAERSCFLDDTRQLRADLRLKHEAAQMAGLRIALERAWFDGAEEGRTLSERHAALFHIWDDCREEEIGVRARQLVESFVRQHMPKGSADAFRDDEIVALNTHRASKAEFKPYG